MTLFRKIVVSEEPETRDSYKLHNPRMQHSKYAVELNPDHKNRPSENNNAKLTNVIVTQLFVKSNKTKLRNIIHPRIFHLLF